LNFLHFIQNEEHTHNNVSAERKSGHFQTFPDNGEDNRSDNRSGKGLKSAENGINDRPERDIDIEDFRRQITDVVDFERPGNSCDIGTGGECEQPEFDRINPCCPRFKFILPDCRECKPYP
jgi:hypothetical protein